MKHYEDVEGGLWVPARNGGFDLVIQVSGNPDLDEQLADEYSGWDLAEVASEFGPLKEVSA